MATKATATQVAKVKTVPAIEKKALAESNKSAGMRMLFDAGYTVVQVRQVFNAPYGYVYGVAERHGVASKAATPRTKAKATAAKKTTAKPVTKVTKVASATSRSGVKIVARATKPATATARVAAKLAARTPAKPGRPSPTRRAANRKAAVASV